MSQKIRSKLSSILSILINFFEEKPVISKTDLVKIESDVKQKLKLVEPKKENKQEEDDEMDGDDEDDSEEDEFDDEVLYSLTIHDVLISITWNG